MQLTFPVSPTGCSFLEESAPLVYIANLCIGIDIDGDSVKRLVVIDFQFFYGILKKLIVKLIIDCQYNMHMILCIISNQYCMGKIMKKKKKEKTIQIRVTKEFMDDLTVLTRLFKTSKSQYIIEIVESAMKR
jgi:hypothetical protein